MPYLDHTSARALAESGYMPLSQYVEMCAPDMALQHIDSPTTAPRDDWEKLERLLISTTINLK